MSSTWDSIFSKSNWSEYPGEELVRFIARNYPDRKLNNYKALELGCGTGANLWYLMKEGFDTYGVDGSSIAIEKCATKLEKEGYCYDANKIYVSDIRDLKFEGNTFDIVIDNEVVCCNGMSYSKTVYDTVHGLLKPGGKLYVRSFSNECTGTEGESHGDGLVMPAFGPLIGNGAIRFSSKEDVRQLLNNYEIDYHEVISRTSDSMSSKVVEHVVYATKI